MPRITSDCALTSVPCAGYNLLYIAITYSVAAWPMLDMSKLFRRPRLSAANRRKASEDANLTLAVMYSCEVKGSLVRMEYG